MDNINLITLITIFVSILSFITTLIEIIRISYKSKDEYRNLKIENKRLRESIVLINSNSGLPIGDIKNNFQTKDDFKMILYWYCSSIKNKLTELYPKCSFRISIKTVAGDTVTTVLTTGDELFMNDSVQFVKDNTEYSAIIKEGFQYFFVTDLFTFNEKKQKYITSDPDWEYKYNTSIVFPVKTQSNNKKEIIGFICINSPQTLQKKNKNNLIIKLLEKTSSNIADILPNF